MFCKYCGVDSIWREGDKGEWLLMPGHQFLGRLISDGDKEADYVFLLDVGSHKDEWNPLDTGSIEEAKRRSLEIAREHCRMHMRHWEDTLDRLG